MANITACLSSDSCEWTTPDELFRQLDDEFHFNLDPCSTDANAKCERHFTIADDGLSQNWGGVSGILQPAVWTRNRRVGRKMFHGIPQGGHRRRSPDTGANVAVNVNHIATFSDYEIRTTDGQTIPVTKSFDEIVDFIKSAAE